MLRKYKAQKKQLTNLEGWGYDRYRSILLQRNFLIILSLISIIGVIISSIIAMKVANSQSLDPFVIEIEKKTGIVTLVDPTDIKKYTINEVVNNYFLVKYIRARELFNPYSYEQDYYTEVRLLSSNEVYSQFRSFIRSGNPNSPVNLYADNLGSSLKIRSTQYLSPDTAQVRFSTEVNLRNRTIRKDRIAIISFHYISIEMNENERYFNPLGFQVISYRVNDEVLE
jgi:type IV secretion system protein VirB8